ncbi:hypothetical protein KP79_PYT05561 [Mizuhopecten yessoensis]|uniref:Uncharacterized protein n=1 Tax=Mizuhopecten yessoensis TaxID=6573 RepID=A0A210PMZ2_MIZYE|nr:hypothetical protein KP79_PYT05561 [Mizuhopecten yessoensis]
MGDYVEFRIGKQKALDKVTIEQWGYANIRIMNKLFQDGTLSNSVDYFNYSATIFRLASKYVWLSVLLYDRKFRELQVTEGFQWGTHHQDLMDLNLILKADSPTNKTIQEAKSYASGSFQHKIGGVADS